MREFRGARRVNEHGEWGYTIAMTLFAQWPEHGCRQVCATSDGFGKDDVELAGGADFVNHFKERRKATAKASAGDFARENTLRSGKRRVDEFFALVVEDDCAAEGALLENACCGEDQAGFASAEKSADQDDRGTVILVSNH
jgi:hypothetical protein